MAVGSADGTIFVGGEFRQAGDGAIPFGGLGASGLGGRAGGEANLEEFTERRWVSLQRAPVEYPY
jgi:acyl-CoA reductase-like NAD-dependent aldehyde dehydrogenase